jgi:hypothetical protein
MQVGNQQRLVRRPEERAFGCGDKFLACERKGNHGQCLDPNFGFIPSG